MGLYTDQYTTNIYVVQELLAHGLAYYIPKQTALAKLTIIRAMTAV